MSRATPLECPPIDKSHSFKGLHRHLAMVRGSDQALFCCILALEGGFFRPSGKIVHSRPLANPSRLLWSGDSVKSPTRSASGSIKDLDVIVGWLRGDVGQIAPLAQGQVGAVLERITNLGHRQETNECATGPSIHQLNF